MALCIIKSFPDLNIGSLQKAKNGKRHDRELVVWYLCRHLDTRGVGRVKAEHLCQFIEEHDLMSLPNLQRRLRRGEGVFWELDKRPQGTTVVLRSLEHVCEALGVLPTRSPIALPLDAFKGLARMRAHFYASWLNERNAPISRQTIEKVTGLSKPSQIRFEKALRIHKEKNLASKLYQPDDQIPAGGFVARDKRGRLWLNVPLPLSFHPLLEQLPRGRLRKIYRRLWGRVKRRAERNEQRYFRTDRQAVKCKHRAKAFYVDTGREMKGCRLWHYCQV